MDEDDIPCLQNSVQVKSLFSPNHRTQNHILHQQKPREPAGAQEVGHDGPLHVNHPPPTHPCLHTQVGHLCLSPSLACKLGFEIQV